MHRLAAVSAIVLFMAGGAAKAADLFADKPAVLGLKPVACLSSFENWLVANPQDCPLSFYGITAYGQIDVGGGYSTHGAPFDRFYNNGVAELVAKFSRGPMLQIVPNGLSQSNAGLKGNLPFVSGFSFVFDANVSFDPYSLQLANGPRSLVENNNVPLQFQKENSDSSRAGQWDNTRGYIGISHPVFGTLTAGRETTFSNDLVQSYDSMGGAYAFSLIGNSSTYVSGVGVSETARYNTSIKYQVNYQNLHAGALAQVGGYGIGNGADRAFQVNLGGDYAGLSLDAIYSYARDAVALSNYGTSPLPAGVSQTDLKATLANVSGLVFAGKYSIGALKLFAGYENSRLSPPSETYPGGFGSLGGYTVLPGAVTTTSYIHNKILQVAWVGARYGLRSDLDVAGAFYWAGQNNYSPAADLGIVSYCAPNTKSAAPGYAPQGAANSTCAGSLWAVSGLIDWRIVPRVDLYAGVMYSKVTGGLANGYLNNNNVAPTVGARLTF